MAGPSPTVRSSADARLLACWERRNHENPSAGLPAYLGDEFDGSALDTPMWKFLTDDRMWSRQKPGNVSVRDGHLIVALKYEEARAMHHKVAGIITSGVSFSAS